MSDRTGNRLAVFLCLSAILICLLPLLTARETRPLRIEPKGGVYTEKILSLRRSEANNSGVDINLADPEEMISLPGIGPYLAAQMTAERQMNGPFYFPEDLLSVKGIGEAKLNGILDQIQITINGGH